MPFKPNLANCLLFSQLWLIGVMDPILREIDEALRRKGMSDAAASKLAVGNFSLIKNMRSARSEDKRYNYQSLERLAEVLDLECYFGPRRDSGPVEVIDKDAEYAHIPVHDVFLAAGAGATNDAEEIVDALAFRRDWLRRIGLDPSKAAIARARGDSMQPSIWDGDLLLIDRNRTMPPVPAQTERPKRMSVFALLHDGEAKVKRLQMIDKGLAMLVSDNPDHPPCLVSPESLQIIGKVVWWGHTSKD